RAWRGARAGSAQSGRQRIRGQSPRRSWRIQLRARNGEPRPARLTLAEQALERFRGRKSTLDGSVGNSMRSTGLHTRDLRCQIVVLRGEGGPCNVPNPSGAEILGAHVCSEAAHGHEDVRPRERHLTLGAPFAEYELAPEAQNLGLVEWHLC